VSKLKVKYDLCVKNEFVIAGTLKMTRLFPDGENGALVVGKSVFLMVSTPLTPFICSREIRPFGNTDILLFVVLYIEILFAIIVGFSVSFAEILLHMFL